MTGRLMLPHRRLSHTFSFTHNTQDFHITVGYYPDGRAGELFINTGQRSGSESDINASDAAILASLALQYGCPVSVLCSAVRRNPDGSPMGPIAQALDIIRKNTA